MWQSYLEISPLTGGLRSRDQSGDVSRGEWESSLPLADMVGKLTLVGNLGSPPALGYKFSGHCNPDFEKSAKQDKKKSQTQCTLVNPTTH